MKRIAYERPDGGVSVVVPCEGARLALGIILADGNRLSPESGKLAPVDSILRRWPVVGATAEWAETEDDFIKRIMAQVVPADAKTISQCLPEEIPERTFRGAWALIGGKITHDMTKARNIHRDRMRHARKPKLEALDVAYLRADEISDAVLKSQIFLQKQALRDVTALPAIETATNVDQLKTVWPEILK